MSLWKCCTCGATERSHLRAPELCLLCGGNRFDCVEYRPDFRRVKHETSRTTNGDINTMTPSNMAIGARVPRKRMDDSKVNGWIQLCSDVSWADYGGMWCKKAKDGSWYVLRFENLLEAGGEDFANTPYSCEVKRIYFPELPKAELDSALRSCGYKFSDDDLRIVNEHDGSFICCKDGQGHPYDAQFLVLVEACIQYGLGAPLETFTGKSRPRNIRAEAKRYASECMKDHAMLDERLDRPVNAIGSTAREYGRGDVTTALFRAELARGNVRRIKHSDIRACPHTILVAAHYREDGSCKCDNLEERQKMIREWGYKQSDFKGIPLRVWA